MEIKGESFSKKRRIGYTQYTERGKIPTEKNKNDSYVEYESLGEATLILLHDHDPNCVEIESQPIQVPNRNKKGKPYTIDFGAKFKDGKRVLYDVKHHTFFERLKKSEERKKNWEVRKEIITKYCENHGFLYEIITDNELYTVRQENIEFFRKNKIEPEQLPIIKPKIVEMLEKQEITRIQLAIELSKRLELDIKEIIPTIDHLIFHDYFLLDFETIIDDNTNLNLKKDDNTIILPIYQFFPRIPKKNNTKTKNTPFFETNPRDPNYDKKNRKEFLALPENIRKKIMKQIELLKIFQEENLTTEELSTYAKKNNVGLSTLYRWNKSFTQEGWVGLIPQNSKRGRKKEIDSKRAILAHKIIKEKYNTDSQPQMTGAFFFRLL